MYLIWYVAPRRGKRGYEQSAGKYFIVGDLVHASRERERESERESDLISPPQIEAEASRLFV